MLFARNSSIRNVPFNKKMQRLFLERNIFALKLLFEHTENKFRVSKFQSKIHLFFVTITFRAEALSNC